MLILKKITTYLIYSFIFLLPWQTRFIYHQGFLNDFNWEYGTFGLYFTELLLGLIIILSIVYLTIKISKLPKNYFSNFKFKSSRRKNLLYFSLILIYLILVSYFSLNSNIAFYKLTFLILATALFFILTVFKIDKIKICWLIIFSALFQSGLAIQQFITQQVIGNKWLGMAEQTPDALGAPIVLTSAGRWLRAFGSLPHPNILAGFLVLSLILIIGLYSHFKIPKQQNILRLIFVINFIGLLTTLSRSGILIFIISLIIFTFLMQRNKFETKSVSKFSLIAIVIIILFTISFPELIYNRTFSKNEIETKSNLTRIQEYKQFPSVIKNNLVLGVGLGNYTTKLHQLNPKLEGWQYQPIHNSYFLIWAELGLFALAGIMIFAFYLFKKLFSKFDSTLKITFFTSLICISCLGLFDHYLWSFYFGLVLFVVILNLNLNNQE